MRSYLDSKMPVNLMQYRGTVGVFNNRKLTKNLQYKEISKLKFTQTCFIADYLYLQIQIIFTYKVIRWFHFCAVDRHFSVKDQSAARG